MFCVPKTSGMHRRRTARRVRRQGTFLVHSCRELSYAHLYFLCTVAEGVIGLYTLLSPRVGRPAQMFEALRGCMKRSASVERVWRPGSEFVPLRLGDF